MSPAPGMLNAEPPPGRLRVLLDTKNKKYDSFLVKLCCISLELQCGLGGVCIISGGVWREISMPVMCTCGPPVASFAHLFLFVFVLKKVCQIVFSVFFSLVVTCWERAGLLVLLSVTLCCVFVTFPYDVLGQVW